MSTAATTGPANRRNRGQQRPATRRRVRRLRHHRRPRKGHDLPLAVPAGGPGPAGLPDRRRGGRRLDGGRPARTRPHQHRGLRREDRRRGIRSLRGAPLLRARRLRGRRHLRASGRGHQGRPDPGVLPRDPAVAVRDGDQGARRGGSDQVGPGRGREALRARRRLGGRAQRAGPRVPRRVPAVPDRPLPGEDGAGRDPLPAVRQHDVRAGLEPELPLVCPDHDGRELRCRGPRPLLRPRRRPARRGRQPPDAGRVGHRDGAPVERRRRGR